MIGEKAYQNAMRRRTQLREELDQIETFLQLCEKFSDMPRGSDPLPSRQQDRSKPDCDARAEAGNQTEGGFKTVVGVELLPYVRQMALDLKRPVSRRDVKERLSHYGLRLNTRDQATYIGTLLWRAKDRFIQLKPHGYWPKDVPYEPAGYQPEQQEPEHDDSESTSQDDNRGVTHYADDRSAASLWDN